METRKTSQDFGKRKPSVPAVARPVRPGPPAKRSGHVALLLMGTFAVGTAAYAVMPRDNCERSPNLPSPARLQSSTECPPRGSSSSGGGGGSARSGFYSSDSSSSHAASGTSTASSGGVTRGGFGSFAHAFGFSGG